MEAIKLQEIHDTFRSTIRKLEKKDYLDLEIKQDF
jgi:hypothetical protein